MSVPINTRFRLLLEEKSKREGRDISLQDVEAATGISRQSLYAWKNNTLERYEANTIDALCKYFEVDLGQLLEYVPDDKKKK